MASLQTDPSGNFHITFRFGGTRFKRSLKTKNKRRAQSTCVRLEENIQLIESGRLELPKSVDLPTFLLSDGKLDGKPVTTTLRLGSLYATYAESIPDHALEATTLKTIALHTRHLSRVLGARRPFHSLKVSELQRYVTARSKEPGKGGRCVSAGTIRKEIATFGALWNWAVTKDYVAGPFPKRGLVFPKLNEKPPFQTWKQIERQIALEQLDEKQSLELWHCLYLDCLQIEELLEFIRTTSTYPFLHPMCLLAAHTGARRSELCRTRVTDFDLEDRTVVIRERKRSRQKRTTRVVPLTPELTRVMKDWFASNPGSPFAFPEDHRVDRNRNQQSTEGRVTPDEASHHFDQVLSQSKWKRIPGWHTLRHSFISNCASRGIDQRFIDAWVGHQTEEQRRRYRHLFPDQQQAAIDSVFSRDEAPR
ncbi:MAG: site-specific integrase [Planctomycetota bacterium]